MHHYYVNGQYNGKSGKKGHAYVAEHFVLDLFNVDEQGDAHWNVVKERI